MSKLDFPLHPKQWIAFTSKATEILYGGSAGAAKALDISTPIWTNNGLKKLVDVHVGDHVFSPDGTLTQVVAETEVMHEHACYKLTFDDGSEIIADAGHLWATLTDAERIQNLRRTVEWRDRRKTTRVKRGTGKRPDLAIANSLRVNDYLPVIPPQIRNTESIAASLHVRGRTNHSIDLAAPINGSDYHWIKPYTFGAWLGDGTSSQGAITCADYAIIDRIEADGFRCQKRRSKYGYGIIGLQKQLRENKLINNKHIPSGCFLAPVEYRIELLRGLMDTDGTVSPDGRLCIGFVDERLSRCVKQLVESLGMKCFITKGDAKINGVFKSHVYRLTFSCWFNPFNLPRKAVRYRPRSQSGQGMRRYIVACGRVPSVPVKCIQVANNDGMFLCGREMIPTHNSHLMRVAAIMWCLAIPGLQVYLFRRLYDDLIKNHMEGPTGFHTLLAPWVGKYVEIVDSEIRFNNGSKIYLCHCQHEKDRFKYQGAEIHVLLIDELTHFTEVIYRFLRSRVRMPANMNIPGEYKGAFPRILCGTNPGGIGHQFVKSTWIDKAAPFEIYATNDNEGGFKRQYIPAKLSDNPSLDQNAYRSNLSGLGNDALVKAMLDGDWDIVAGAALNINRDRHLIRPFKPPQHWTKFQGLDYGYVKPFSAGWYAVVEGNTLLEAKGNHEAVFLPDKAVVRYREYYGWNGKPNEGLKLESPQLAKNILNMEKEAEERMDYRVSDTQLWAKNDGPSMAERMFEATKGAFNPRKAIKDRQAGYAEICNRLKGMETEDGFLPMFYITENCTHFWRTMPSLVLDDLQPEKGPDEHQELHVYDEVSYSLTSYPYVTTKIQRIERAFKAGRRLIRENKDPYATNPMRVKRG